jgi:hypothetical protein
VVARRGQAPVAPVQLPKELLLKVARSLHANTPGVCAIIRGEAPDGALVTVDGSQVEVAEGRFQVSVPRKPGMTFVNVVAQDVLGRSRREKVKCSPAVARGKPQKIEDLRIQWGTGP